MMMTAVSKQIRRFIRGTLPMVGAAVALALTPPVHAAELVTNASLERDHGYDFVEGWDFHPSASTHVTTTTGFDGTNSVMFDLSAGTDPEYCSAVFPVRPGESYTAQCWYRVDQAFSQGHVAVLIRWWRSPNRADWDGQSVVQDNIGAAVTSGWQLAQGVVTAPAATVYGEVCIYGGGGLAKGPNGKAYFDAFSLKPVAAVSSAASNPYPADGTPDARMNTVLQWSTVPTAKSYNLYLGTNYPAVASATEGSPLQIDHVAYTVAPLRYAVTLDPNSLYFWRVDAVDSAGVVTPGNVWSFFVRFDLAEDVPSLPFNQYRYDSKDSSGYGLDGLKVIPNPAGGYLGVHHSYIGGQFEARLALSTDLTTWQHVRTLARPAGMPGLMRVPLTGGFVLTHEDYWWNTELGGYWASSVRFAYYASLNDLLTSAPTRVFTAPVSSFSNMKIEGTPNLFSVSPDGNHIEAGFHYLRRPEMLDHNATGTLLNLVSGTPSWTAQINTQLNSDLAAKGVPIAGDRDYVQLLGKSYFLVEGQYRQSDFSSWRCWFQDARGTFLPLYLQTHKGSRSYGNLTSTFLTLPSGKPGLLMTYFIFSELSKPGEPGAFIFFRELQMQAREPLPASGATSVSPTGEARCLAGFGATRHDAYLSTDPAVAASADTTSPAYRGRLAHPTLPFSGLAYSTAYYWRMDEVAADGTVTKGPVWSFTTTSPPAGIADWSAWGE